MTALLISVIIGHKVCHDTLCVSDCIKLYQIHRKTNVGTYKQHINIKGINNEGMEFDTLPATDHQ